MLPVISKGIIVTKPRKRVFNKTLIINCYFKIIINTIKLYQKWQTYESALYLIDIYQNLSIRQPKTTHYYHVSHNNVYQYTAMSKFKINPPKKPLPAIEKEIEKNLYSLKYLDLRKNRFCAVTGQPTDLVAVAEDLGARVLRISWLRANYNQNETVQPPKHLQGYKKDLARRVESLLMRKWIHDTSEEGTKIAESLISTLRYMNCSQSCSTSVSQYRAIKKNRKILESLAKNWQEENQEIETKSARLIEVKRFENNAKLFSYDKKGIRYHEGYESIVLTYVPPPEHIESFISGAINTDELGMSQLLPGAVGYMTVAIDNTKIDADSPEVHIDELQGMYRINGPFKLSSSVKSDLSQYPDMQKELIRSFFELYSKNGEKVSFRIGAHGEKNTNIFKEVAEQLNYQTREVGMKVTAFKQ